MESHYSDTNSMKETINIKRDTDITPITYIDSGQIAEIKKHGNKFHEFNMLEAIAKMDFPKGTFLDIGAHVGNHSVFFAKYCKSCEQVIAYEASGTTFRWLCDNISMLKNVFAHNAAVSDKDGECYVLHNYDRPGQTTVHGGYGTMQVTIDSMPFLYPPVLIKIDVEGTEYDILEGAKQTISKYRPELFVETFRDPEKLLNHLPKGYRLVKRYNNAPTYHLTSK